MASHRLGLRDTEAIQAGLGLCANQECVDQLINGLKENLLKD
jgi:hypothetical protein